MTATRDEPPTTTGRSAEPESAAGSGVPDADPAARGNPPRSRATVILLAAAAAIVLLLVGATAGLALSGKLGNSAPATPDNSSVDAGFARDMIVHHDQGVLMAHYAEQNTSDPEIGVMAYDIGYTQTDQIGRMQGWLSLWDLPESGDGTHMGWMGGTGEDHGGMVMTTPSGAAAGSAGATGSVGTATGSVGTAAGSVSAAAAAPAAEVPLMPGMATASEIAKLRSLTGVESDIYFLQLMVRHHQGGAPMMQYAADHATNAVVRNFASKMALSQGAEISVMTQMLAERGAQPLPAN